MNLNVPPFLETFFRTVSVCAQFRSGHITTNTLFGRFCPSNLSVTESPFVKEAPIRGCVTRRTEMVSTRSMSAVTAAIRTVSPAVCAASFQLLLAETTVSPAAEWARATEATKASPSTTVFVAPGETAPRPAGQVETVTVRFGGIGTISTSPRSAAAARSATRFA